MAREQLGTPPSRPTDPVTVNWSETNAAPSHVVLEPEDTGPDPATPPGTLVFRKVIS